MNSAEYSGDWNGEVSRGKVLLKMSIVPLSFPPKPSLCLLSSLQDTSPSISALWKGMHLPSLLSVASAEYEDFGGQIDKTNSQSFLQGFRQSKG